MSEYLWFVVICGGLFFLYTAFLFINNEFHWRQLIKHSKQEMDEIQPQLTKVKNDDEVK